MVDRERQRRDRPYRWRAVPRDDAVRNAADRKDRGLGRIHDRGKAIDAYGAEVRHGEDGTGELVLGKLPRVGVLLESRTFGRERPTVLVVRVAEYGDEQSILERDSEADVRRIARHELAFLDARPKSWVVAERLRRRRDDGVGVRRTGCLALLVGRGHVDVARDGKLRLLAHALGHPLPDGAPHPRKRFSFLL